MIRLRLTHSPKYTRPQARRLPGPQARIHANDKAMMQKFEVVTSDAMLRPYPIRSGLTKFCGAR
jgi:hypothetical protein